jgi:hypothetical protein
MAILLYKMGWLTNTLKQYILNIYIINNKKMSHYALMLKFIIIGDSGKLFLIILKGVGKSCMVL